MSVIIEFVAKAEESKCRNGRTGVAVKESFLCDEARSKL